MSELEKQIQAVKAIDEKMIALDKERSKLMYKILKSPVKVNRVHDRSLESLRLDCMALFWCAYIVFDVTEATLKSADRHAKYNELRMMMYVILCDKGYVVAKIAAEFNRHHATVLHAKKQHRNHMEIDKVYRQKFIELNEKFTNQNTYK